MFLSFSDAICHSIYSDLIDSYCDMLLRASHIAIHVVSQMCNRWFPPPDFSEIQTDFGMDLPGDEDAISRLSVDDWDNLLDWLRLHDRISAGCLNIAELKFGATQRSVATSIYTFVKDSFCLGASLVTIDQTLYPSLLRYISDPPLVLSVLGNTANLEGVCESIVGSRQASAFALRESFHLGRYLSQKGIVVVSGGAIGCDIAAHRGVLASGGSDAKAIVVFAGGLSALYPKVNSYWFKNLIDRGATFVSERLITAPCRRWDFAARNRIIAGLSNRLYVMQAASASGAMVTARLALDQGREVIVLVHPPGDVRALGGTSLINDGAIPIYGCANNPI